ncbi:MAG: hypothetical protein GOV00_01690 [Candidatus Altiarchaeota archaeon]|nr:hypothetical protein [Candidatus Altiarchaeota archaeon]
MGRKLVFLFFVIMMPVFACFSLADLGSIEIETPVDISKLSLAKNVNMGVIGSFRNPIDPKVAVIFNKEGFRLIFPTTESEFFACEADEKYIFVKENCSTGTVISHYGERTYYVDDQFTFEAIKAPCEGSECGWKLSMDYLEFPRDYLVGCWRSVVWSCKLVNKSVVLGYGERGVDEIVNKTVEYLNDNNIINLKKQDLADIASVSRLGHSGHNNRLVKFEGKWMPYSETENAELIREITLGGCGEDETVEDVPEDVLQFSNVLSKNPFTVFFRKLLQFLGINI